MQSQFQKVRIPLLTNARHLTTTLTLPGPSLDDVGGAIVGKGSEARIDGAEAVVCSAEYIFESK